MFKKERTSIQLLLKWIWMMWAVCLTALAPAEAFAGETGAGAGKQVSVKAGFSCGELICSGGNFFAAGEMDEAISETKLLLTFSGREKEDLDLRLKLSLPEGFRFEKDLPEMTREEEIHIPGGEEAALEMVVYPLYTDAARPQFLLHIEGDLEMECPLPVSVNPDEGRVLLAGTPGVNRGILDADGNRLPMTVRSPQGWRQALSQAPTEQYDDNLAGLGCMLSMAVYLADDGEEGISPSEEWLRRSLYNLGFSKFQWYPNSSAHNVGTGIAQKTMLQDGKIQKILVIIVRGTVDREWIGNFNVIGWDRSVHADFDRCAEQVRDRIGEYLEQYPGTYDRAFMFGHSRGAAVANLAAHKLNEEPEERIRELSAYTFAAPNTTREPGDDPNIFNYVYAYDLVAWLPHADYGKHGKTFVVGGENSDAAPAGVAEAFQSYTNGNTYEKVGSMLVIQILIAMDSLDGSLELVTIFQNEIGRTIAQQDLAGDNEPARAHCAENYLSWILNSGIRDYRTMEDVEKDMMNDPEGKEASSFVEDLHRQLDPGLLERILRKTDSPLLSRLYWIGQAYEAGKQSVRLYHLLQSYAQTDMAREMPHWQKVLLGAD